MKIIKAKVRNFGPYGNNWVELDFTNIKNSFSLIVGQNGSGKCINPDTIIDVKFSDQTIEENFKKYIDAHLDQK